MDLLRTSEPQEYGPRFVLISASLLVHRAALSPNVTFGRVGISPAQDIGTNTSSASWDTAAWGHTLVSENNSAGSRLHYTNAWSQSPSAKAVKCTPICSCQQL